MNQPHVSNEPQVPPVPQPTIAATPPSQMRRSRRDEISQEPDGTSAPSSRGKRKHNVIWSLEMERALFESLLQGKREGLENEPGNFKATVWDSVVDFVGRATSQPVTRVNCVDKWSNVKKKWKLWEQFRGLPGWTYDCFRNTYATDRVTMDRYFAEHPDMKPFMKAGPSHQDILDQLLDAPLPTGRLSSAARMPRSPLGLVNYDGPVRESVETPQAREANLEDPFAWSPVVSPGPQAPASPADNRRRETSEDQTGRRRRRSTASSPTAHQRHTKKRKSTLQDRLDSLRQDWERSNKQLRDEMMLLLPCVQEALAGFLEEVDDLLPAHWQNGEEGIPRYRFQPVLTKLRDVEESLYYLALRKKDKKIRRKWALEVLGYDQAKLDAEIKSLQNQNGAVIDGAVNAGPEAG